MKRSLVIGPALVMAACGAVVHAGEARSVPEYPGTLARPSDLRSPDGLGEAFALDHRVRAESPEGVHEFRAVLQKLEDTLVVVALGPHGGRAFVLTQRGDDVELESHLPRELPFPPRFMLMDIHRAWFAGLDGPLPDGEHRAERDGEEIVERWEGGMLRERTFRRLDGRPTGTIRIAYEPGLGGSGPPREVRLHNGWFGYTLTLTTLSHQRITTAEGASEVPDEVRGE